MLNVEKVFITHYLPLVERKTTLEKSLKDNLINAQWVEQEPENVSSFYQFSENNWQEKIKPFNYGTTIPPRMLKKSELSLAFKHIQIYKRIVENNIKNALILEDDVILINNFVKNFNFYLENNPKDWNIIFIGSGCDLRIPLEKRQKNVTAYLKDHPAGKCTDSYIINLETAKNILNSINKITLPIDFELNYLMWMNKCKVFWWEPALVMQGSQCGFFNSTIQ